MIDSWDCCYHFLLVEGVQRHLSLVAKTQYCAVLVSQGGGYQVTVSLLPPLQPSPVSWIKWRAHAAGDGSECPLICCVMGHVNSCWTCSDARNIGWYNSSQIRFDTIHPVSVLIRDRSDNRPFSNSESESFLHLTPQVLLSGPLLKVHQTCWKQEQSASFIK